MTRALCGFFNACTAAEHDQIGERNLLATRLCLVELVLEALQ